MPKTAQRNPAPAPHHVSPMPRETSTWQAPHHSHSSGPSPDTGLMVLSSSMRILHMNHRARSLMAQFGEAHELWPHLSPESMPAILIEFCGEVLAQLQRQAGNHEWAEFEMCRICHMLTPALLLRGFGVPSTDGRTPRMILTLQPCVPSSDPAMLRNRPDASTSASPDLGHSTH